jgi:hypothetical protein
MNTDVDRHLDRFALRASSSIGPTMATFDLRVQPVTFLVGLSASWIFRKFFNGDNQYGAAR